MWQQMDKNKDQENVVSSSSEKTEPEAVVQPPQLQGTKDDDATPDTTQEDETPPAEKPAPPPTAAVSAPEPPRIKHDWYQTHADVVVNVMIKRLRREDVRVEFGERRLEVDIDLGEGRSHSLVFALAHPVVKEKCSFKILTTKVSVCVGRCQLCVVKGRVNVRFCEITFTIAYANFDVI